MSQIASNMNNLKMILIVFAGSGIGGVCRYLLHRYITNHFQTVFPWGTFAVNVIGCFIIGTLFTVGQRNNAFNEEWRLLLATGFCGGFTTFSAFSLENMNLIRTGEYLNFSFYAGGSVLLGFVAVFAGAFVAKFF